MEVTKSSLFFYLRLRLGITEDFLAILFSVVFERLILYPFFFFNELLKSKLKSGSSSWFKSWPF